MEQRLVKPWVILFFINFHNTIIKKVLVHTGTMDQQYLQTLMAEKQKKNNKKDKQKMFKDNYINITIQCNLKIFNYLIVTFNLSNATYQPFCKPNNNITYIHNDTNRTPSALRQAPLPYRKDPTHIYREALKNQDMSTNYHPKNI